MTELAEVAAGVYVLRFPVLDVNATLVVGDTGVLVVDTLSTTAQAAELVGAVRRVTALPWAVVNTHHHFDHCFGNAVVAGPDGCAIYAHEDAAALLRDRPEALRLSAAAEFPALATELESVTVMAPNHRVHLDSTVDIGGRVVVLRHLGRGHTAGDLIVHVPDADVVLAGDLVEESGPPSFEDAYPLEWPETLASLLTLLGPSTRVVPGHGAVVGRDFVAAQHAELTALAWAIRDGHADGAAPEKVAASGVVGGLVAVRRGYAELAGLA